MKHVILRIALLLLVTSAGLAQVPEAITVQGFLTNDDGSPFDGLVDMNFVLYIAGTDDQVWSQPAFVDVNHGVYEVILDGLSPVAFDGMYELETTVGDEVPLAPRTLLTSVPYALSLRGLRVYNTTEMAAPNLVGGHLVNDVGEGVVGATISGGGRDDGVYAQPNSVFASWGTVGGGLDNEAGIFGGAGDWGATVGGGQENRAQASYSTICGGASNLASGVYSVVIGGGGDGSSNIASGPFSTVAGGLNNTADGLGSFAAGFGARALHQGAFVWSHPEEDLGDPSGWGILASTGPDQFIVSAPGGVGIGTNAPDADLHISSVNGWSWPQLKVEQTASADYARIRMLSGSSLNHWDIAVGSVDNNRLTFWHSGVGSDMMTVSAVDGGRVGISRVDPAYPIHVGTNTNNGNGAHVTKGGTWTDGSSKTFKTNIRPINQSDILRKVVDLPILRWEYKDSDEGEHIGPMAEDFHEAFSVGGNPKYLSGTDRGGVALASIQALYDLIEQQHEEISELRERLQSLEGIR